MEKLLYIGIGKFLVDMITLEQVNILRYRPKAKTE
jgi:hypothetical protein